MTHPCLLFENISETPGYQHRTESPWLSWESTILAMASSNVKDAALAYQITKDTAYAEDAKTKLLNIEIWDGSFPGQTYDLSKANNLQDYALAYDWVQPYLDSASDEIIRDKLAQLADSVYDELNLLYGERNYEYISFADFHGQAYPSVAIAGCVLSDYTNPNGLPLSSMPVDWKKCGIEYMFENDILHNWNRPLINMGFDYAGEHNNGAYKCYVIDNFLLWFQVYSHFFNKNILEEYPMAKKIVVTELWNSLPNRYAPNYCTNGNIKWYYHRGIMSLLDDENKACLLNHDDIIEPSTLLPYSRSIERDLTEIFYLCYGDYSSITRKDPEWTSYFNTDSSFQVFRNNRNEDSDWLSLITWYMTYSSNRQMAHHDQLSFEYYSRGNLLLADGGEEKDVLDKYYGRFPCYHNTILIEDPRSPFDMSSYANSRARGIFKGNWADLRTPATINNIIQTDYMEALDTEVNITSVVGPVYWYTETALSSPINYKRTILYPNKEYFIVIDSLEGRETWTYRNVFRPASLNITHSTGSSESEVGHVNGDLTIGGSPYDWLALSYKDETDTGISTSSIKWNTTNPYGKDVGLYLFSVPSSEIRVTKHVTKIAGFDSAHGETNVFLPLVCFRVGEHTNDLYRITTLLPKYTTEEEKIPEEVPVTGNGNAVKVTSGATTDLIYAGIGESSFGELITNAGILHFRKSGVHTSAFTFLRGSYVDDQGSRKIDISKQIDYITLKYDGNNRTFNIKGNDTSATITLYQMDPTVSYQVKRDGNLYTNWVLNGAIMTITTQLSEHTFDIIDLSKSGTIIGNVTDKSTGLPISGATITANGYSTSTE